MIEHGHGERYDPVGELVFHRRIAEAPALLEYGGEATRRVGKLVKAEHYRPRPFMGPAFEIEKRNLSPLWRDSVR